MQTVFTRFLTGKTALVTGSISGIGLGIAKQLSAAGANIVLNGLGDQEQVDKATAIISKNNVKTKFIYADVGKPEEVNSMVEQATK